MMIKEEKENNNIRMKILLRLFVSLVHRIDHSVLRLEGKKISNREESIEMLYSVGARLQSG